MVRRDNEPKGLVDTRVMDERRAVTCFAHRTNYKEFNSHSRVVLIKRHIWALHVNDIPGRHFENTLTLCIHTMALRAFASGTQVLNVEKVSRRCCFQKTGTKE